MFQFIFTAGIFVLLARDVCTSSTTDLLTSSETLPQSSSVSTSATNTGGGGTSQSTATSGTSSSTQPSSSRVSQSSITSSQTKASTVASSASAAPASTATSAKTGSTAVSTASSTAASTTPAFRCYEGNCTGFDCHKNISIYSTLNVVTCSPNQCAIKVTKNATWSLSEFTCSSGHLSPFYYLSPILPFSLISLPVAISFITHSPIHLSLYIYIYIYIYILSLPFSLHFTSPKRLLHLSCLYLFFCLSSYPPIHLLLPFFYFLLSLLSLLSLSLCRYSLFAYLSFLTWFPYLYLFLLSLISLPLSISLSLHLSPYFSLSFFYLSLILAYFKILINLDCHSGGFFLFSLSLSLSLSLWVSLSLSVGLSLSHTLSQHHSLLLETHLSRENCFVYASNLFRRCDT
ncbi:unnamed protein product [Acanthosepion pharaonis]|uniref:Uncharacterized protein n=1 Tax=Acanthosepion pharaonis TaxID=158019 RepID=A0A812BZA9_ACAPH|nr:unnamed protein product [Sepia pharaonis]